MRKLKVICWWEGGGAERELKVICGEGIETESNLFWLGRKLKVTFDGVGKWKQFVMWKINGK